MINELVVVNQAPDSEPALSQGNSHWLTWETCVRRIYFGHRDHVSDLRLTPQDKIYKGEDAYRFVMEVICGLHSPIVGETQVFGQFKQLIANVDMCPSPLSKPLANLLLSLSTDCKRVRQEHLSGLGSQSYGSVVRRKMGHLQNINFIGAGILVQEIVPYMYKLGMDVKIFCRSPHKAMPAYKAYPGVEILHQEELSIAPLQDGLVVAAPLSSVELQHMLSGPHALDHIIDLRGDSHTDPLAQECRVESLLEIFSEIEQTKARLKDSIVGAHGAITGLLNAKRQQVHVRPFGWDDLYF